jgi:prolyl oligopeptidase
MFALLAASLWAENDAENVAGNSADDPAAGPAKPPSAPSAARVAPVGESWHGHTVVDNYRGLEDSANPDTRTWVEGQLAYTRSLLDPLPGRQQMEQRLTELLAVGTISAPQPAGSYYFYTRRDGHQNQPILYVRAGLHGDDRVLLDPNTLAADGTVALDWWYPSEDGKHVAYGISPGGSEISTLHVIETATGKLLPDAIDRARAASVAWKKDDSGFYYTRLPRKGEVAEGQELYNRHVFYHALGTDPAHDPLILGEGRNPQDWPNVSLSEDGRWLLITVQVTYTKTELFLQDTSTTAPLLRITPGLESIYHGEVFHGDLYITSNEGAPRYRVFRASTAHPEREHWQEIIPQSDAVLNGAGVIGGKLFSQYEKDASSRLRVHSLEGKLLEEIPLPGIGTVFGTGGRHDRDEAFFAFHSYTVPPSVYRYDLKIKQTETWAQVKAPIDPAAYEVKQLWYTSKDGTRVPMFVVHKKGLVLNGKNPTLLTGYGGFNVSSTPNFNGTRYVWLEHGGVYAVANLRGGSEFGEDWHQAGMLEKKQNVFDDFFAAGEFLIAQGYTDKAHLAAQGGSNGGLLMGVAVTQRPDLWRAVVCQVPLLDMLRYQNFQIARLWIPEYGSAENPKQFDYLYAYSPYHHVKAGTEYPAILFMTADTDTRVDPMHAKKMAALMQAEAKNGQSKDRPILLRIEPKAGHGAGKPVHKVIEEGVDIYSFLFWQLGVRP